MHERFADMLFRARQNAGYSREKAAELLDSSVRSLSYYEAGRPVPDQLVARMVDLYHAPLLGYTYLRQMKTGQLLLPPVESASAARSALRLRVGLDKAAKQQSCIEYICESNAIGETEEKTLLDCLPALQYLASACIGFWILCIEKAAANGTRNGL